MALAAATKGDILIKNVIPKHLEPITDRLTKMGVTVEEFDDSIRVFRTGDVYKRQFLGKVPKGAKEIISSCEGEEGLFAGKIRAEREKFQADLGKKVYSKKIITK